MKRFLLYALAATFSFAAFIVIFAPASIAWRIVQDDVNANVPGLKVVSIAGSVWSGSAAFKYGALPVSDLDWNLAPLALLSQSLHIKAILSSDGLRVLGPIEISAESAALNLTGFVEAEYVNPISAKYGLVFPGALEILQLELETNRAWFTRADGQFHWTGGTVSYGTWEGPQRVSLPPLDGTLSQVGDEITLNVTAEGDTLLTIVMQPTGWAKVEIKARLFILARLPWPTESDQDANALVLEEKLF